MPTSPAIASHAVCSWGSVGPSVPGIQPSWVIGMFELRAFGSVRGLQLERIELVDGAGRTVATAATELELRRVPPGRSQQDFSRYDTQDFDGLVPTGETVRLWMHGRLDRDFSAIMSTTPARYRATLVTADGARLAVEGPLDPPWPTA